VSATEIGDEDPDFAGGCYLHVQKYVHDMDSWDSLSVTEQELVIGRTKLEYIEMDDDAKPANAHIALNGDRGRGRQRAEDRPAQHCRSVRSVRRVRHVFHRLLAHRRRHRADAEQHVHRDPVGNTDRILDFSTAVTGGKFFTRSSTFSMILRRFRIRSPKKSNQMCRRCQWVARDRQPERNTSMNNLYRDLAPITEAAWTEIETEATRTFKRHIAGRRVVDVSEPGGPVTAAISTGHLRDVAPPGTAWSTSARQQATGPAARAAHR